MIVHQIISYVGDSNCYVIEDDAICLVDTGYSERMLDKIRKILKTIGRNVDFVVNTHCHYDHIGNDDFFANNGAKILIHKYDSDAVLERDDMKILARIFNKDAPEIEKYVINALSDKRVINLGKTKLKVVHTPGHTCGSISLYERESKSLFSGDLVFADGIGRSDFAGGDISQLKSSIEKILKLDFEKLYPGHGRVGTRNDVERIYEFIKTP